ncbi:hypothetical protein MNB_SV-12-1248 [hydrothermal vent metagenome]|uniref:Uncharacterized protein n=1 Tax=hydrothermal vent metagenome TaxID=652676 RepID=A0A1W1C295_9ZZZZ
MLKEDRDKERLAQKTDFVIKNYTGGALEVANLFGYKKSTSITNICNFDPRRAKDARSIVRLQMEGLEKHYQIPVEIFDHSVRFDEELISNMIEEYRIKLKKQKETTSIFTPNSKLLKKLEGIWYSYFYPSADFIELQSIQTTINPDYSVIDEYGNRGIVNFGVDQSIIIKESKNSKNLTSIIFNNRTITYNIFPYSMISRTNSSNRAINYFGFFSRKKFDIETAKKILGKDRSLMQIQIPYEFEDRMAPYYRIDVK